jgi:pantoate--beta-alanine ligase
MQRLAKKWQSQLLRIGLVPTMGYLHAGHLSLLKRARSLVGTRGKVVVSIYVNPTQFGPDEDFSRYPRDFARDAALCRAAEVDILFVPSDEQMYPRQGAESFSTYVTEQSLSRGMEGASRPTHFRGVTTVVAKLFNIVQPGIAVFGAKDYQQAAIIRRMTRDLNFPVRMVIAPTFREPDGLAMSSRNKYLDGALRTQARVLSRALARVKTMISNSRRPPSSSRLKRDLKRFIELEAAARLDYVEFFHPDTLVPVSQVSHGVHMALAVFIGKTRLIDNARL